MAVQFLKFGVIGLANTFLSLSIYYFFVYVGVNYLLANTIAFIITVANSYFWNNRYVFRKTSAGHLKAITKVYICYGATFLISTFLLYVMVDWLGISKYIAPILNLFVTVPLNFILNRFWAFK